MAHETHSPTGPDALDLSLLKALAEPTRVDILLALAQSGPSDVKTLADGLPQDRSVISRHLSVMEAAGLVISEKQGRHVVYAVNGPQLVGRMEDMAVMVKRLVEEGCC